MFILGGETEKGEVLVVRTSTTSGRELYGLRLIKVSGLMDDATHKLEARTSV